MNRRTDGLRARLSEAVQRVGPRPLPADRLAIVTMSRDAVDVLPSFLSHHATLVDRMYVVDHRSVDGSREYLEEVAEDAAIAGMLEVLRYDGAAHNQAVIFTELFRRAFRDGADWVLAVDDDEFVAADSRQKLVDHLRSASAPVVQFEWVNLIPNVFGRPPFAPIEFDPEGEFLWLSEGLAARYGKLALHREFFRAFPHFMLHTGNHKVRPYPGGPKLSGEPVGRLLHVPARSVTQVISKRRNLLGTSDFGDVFHGTWSGEYGAQQRQAQLLARGELDDGQVLRLFEQVVLPYEPDALDRLDRSLWNPSVVRLPPSARPSSLFSRTKDESHALRPLRGGGEVVLVGRPDLPRSCGAASLGPVFAHIRTDGRVVVRTNRLRALRRRCARLGAEIALLGPVRYLATRTHLRHPVRFIRTPR